MADPRAGLRVLDDQVVDGYDPAHGLSLPDRIAWAVSVAGRGDAGEDVEDVGARWSGLLQSLLRDPAAPRLRTLILDDWSGQADLYDTPYEEGDPLPLMTRHAGRLVGLERLYIGPFPAALPPTEGVCQGVGPALTKLPALTRLDLHGASGWALIPAKGHPRLRTLVMHVGELGDDSLANLIAAPFPALERVDLWLGPEALAEDAGEAEELAAALSSAKLPGLRELALRGLESPALLEALGGQTLELQALAITHALGLGGALEGLLQAPWLGRLRRLELSGTGVSAELAAELAARGPVVVGAD